MKRKMYIAVTILLAVVLLVACSNQSNPPTNVKTDPNVGISSGILFTANESRSISKIDLTKNEAIASIEADGSVHNVQLSPDGKVLAATVVPSMGGNEESTHAESGESDHGHEMMMNGIVNFYDSASNQLIKAVEVGAHPAHVVYTNDGKYALITNNESNNVTVVDIGTYTVVHEIATGKGPHGFRISSDDKFAYIANMGEDTVSVIDLAQMKESKRIKVGAAPVTTSVTKDGKTLAVTLNGENALAIVDLTSDKVDKIGVGTGPAQVYIEADGRFAFVANQGSEDNPSQTVSKVDLQSRKVSATIETGKGAHGIVSSPDMTRVYVTNMYDDTLSVIDNSTNQVIDTIKTGKIPNGVTISPH